MIGVLGFVRLWETDLERRVRPDQVSAFCLADHIEVRTSTHLPKA
jgi:hypothetical protein